MDYPKQPWAVRSGMVKRSEPPPLQFFGPGEGLSVLPRRNLSAEEFYVKNKNVEWKLDHNIPQPRDWAQVLRDSVYEEEKNKFETSGNTCVTFDVDMDCGCCTERQTAFFPPHQVPNIVNHPVCFYLAMKKINNEKKDEQNSQNKEPMNYADKLADLIYAEAETQPTACPRHYKAGQDAGPHTYGDCMSCGCCMGTCEICMAEECKVHNM